MTDEQQFILDHYKNPRNVGRLDGEDVLRGKSENLSCGDAVEIFVKEGPGKKILEVGFVAEGCSICIAAASILTERLEGSTLEKAGKITEDELLNLVKIPLNPTRKQCALLCLKALNSATAQ